VSGEQGLKVTWARVPLIYHITSRAEWETALASGSFAADSLRTEGFIHCSTAEQVLATANRLFKGRTDLVLLCIETDSVQAEIRYENLEGGASRFPHVYGSLATGSIRAVHAFPPETDGRFELPSALQSILPPMNADGRR
jgi:uncharacterized protein (DUF952 family)